MAVVLAGGLGTRVRGLHPDLPKPMIPVGGAPFLHHVLAYLRDQGVARVVVSTGHKAEVIERWVARDPLPGLAITTAREPRPLGTAGGFLEAVRSLDERGETWDEVLVANGDSLVRAPLGPARERLARPGVCAVVLGVAVEDGARFGRLELESGGRLRAFREKEPGPGLVNAGVYLFRRSTVATLPGARPLSFERDVFPALLTRGEAVEVETVAAPFIDMGTPESLAGADAWVARYLGPSS